MNNKPYYYVSSEYFCNKVLSIIPLKSYLEDLSEYLRIDKEILIEKNKDWIKIKKNDWLKNNDNFYNKSKAYLYAYINSDRARYSRFHYLVLPYLKGSTVLDYGCGVGDIGIYCYFINNMEVTLSDINSATYDFLKYRIDKYNLPISIKTLNELQKQYDTVICLSTLEHIKDWKKVFIDLFNLTIRGGNIILKIDLDTTEIDHIAPREYGLNQNEVLNIIENLNCELLHNKMLNDNSLYCIIKKNKK